MAKPNPALLPHREAIPKFLNLIEDSYPDVRLADVLRRIALGVRANFSNFKRDWFRWRNGEVMPGLNDLADVFSAARRLGWHPPKNSAPDLAALFVLLDSVLSERREQKLKTMLPVINRFVDQASNIVFAAAELLDLDYRYSLPIALDAFCDNFSTTGSIDQSTRVEMAQILRSFAEKLEAGDVSEENEEWEK